jgi:hypothetical protein
VKRKDEHPAGRNDEAPRKEKMRALLAQPRKELYIREE